MSILKDFFVNNRILKSVVVVVVVVWIDCSDVYFVQVQVQV